MWPLFLLEARMRVLSVTEALSVKEAAQILSRHPNTVKRYVKQGRLPAIRDRCNNWRRFDPQVVAKFKEELNDEAD